MARRPVAPKPKPVYEFPTMQACEESEPLPSGAHHRAEVTVWPPRGNEHPPSQRGRCTRCGCHLPLYGANDPQQSDIEVVVLQSERKVSKAS